MSDARVLLALAGLLAVALLCVSAGVRPALAPLCAAAAAALWFSAFGCLGLLRAGGAAFYLLCAAAAGWLVWRHCVKKVPLPRPGFGFWFFAAASAAAVLLMWWRQPVFLSDDEFSFWGTAGKLTKLYGELYVTAPVGWAWPATQTPALISFGYFFQFFGGEFIEWQQYAACNVFQIAAIAALLAPFGKRDTDIALPAAAVGLLTPFMLWHYSYAIYPSPIYADTLADMPMGLWFFAAIAAWFAGKRRLADLVPACAAIAALALVKDIGVFLALVAAAVIFLDCLLARREEGTGRLRHAGAAAARGGIALSGAAAAFAGWSVYLARAAGVDRIGDVGGARRMGMLEMPFAFFAELFSPGRSERFTGVLREMGLRFFGEETTMLGTGAATALAALGVTALAWALAGRGALRRRCAVFGAAGALGFAAYSLLLAMCYIYIFRAEQAQVLDSYRRYVMPYLAGWFLCAVLLLCMAAASARGARRLMAGGAVLAAAALAFVRVAQLVPARRTVLAPPADTYAVRREFTRTVDELKAQIPEDPSFWVISGADGGHLWFMACYEMLPRQIDYSFGGQALVRRELQTDGTVQARELTAAEWAEYLAERGCKTVVLLRCDEHFKETYGALFSDGLAAYEAGEARVYGVRRQGGELSLWPLTGDA